MKNELHVGFKAPLNIEDKPHETYGCRASDPDICKNNGTSFCAFCRQDKICKIPPRTWPKQYKKLKSEEK